jgi:NADPH:quinone reductase-like Zn-dependent oxidoreductase
LGADFVFDYRDPEIVSKIRESLEDQTLPHAFDAVGSDDSTLRLLESLVSPGGDIILALPPTRLFPNHHCEMCIAGTINNLQACDMPQFKFHEGKEPPKFDEGAGKLQKLMRWALDGAGTEYVVPKVRRLGSRGMEDALRGFEMMRKGEIRGEKIVYRVRDTPGIQVIV